MFSTSSTPSFGGSYFSVIKFCSNSSFVNEELMYDTRGADFDACEISEQNSPFTNDELFGFLFRNGSGPNSSFVNDELFRLVKF